MPSSVIVLGGGVAGMSAAHELIERGFEVVVLERRDIAGGKARSIPVSDDGAGRSGHVLADTGVASIEHRLPGEHGFRFFPGLLQARGRHHAAHPVVRRTPGGGPPGADDARRLHAIRQAHIRDSGDLPAERRPMPARCCATSSSPSVRSPASRRTIWRSSARASGRS